MTTHAVLIAERLQAAAERIPVESRLDAIQGTAVNDGVLNDHAPATTAITFESVDRRVEGGDHRSWSSSRLALVAASFVIIVGGLALAMSPRLTGTEIGVQPGGPAPAAPIPAGAPAPGSVAPIVDNPPDWFGQPRAAEREGGYQTGRWVSMAIGIESDDGSIQSPIRVAVTDDGALRDLDLTQTVTVAGQSFHRLQFDNSEWQILATTSQPMVVVSGAVDEGMLAEVHRSVRLTTFPEGLSLHLDELPDGYVELVAPQVHAEDVDPRRTLVGDTRDVGINEVSDWVQPELAAAASGVTYRSVSVGNEVGWTGRTQVPSFAPITFLTWSPAPGVVLEITTSNEDRSVDDLIQLAVSTSVLPNAEWDAELKNS